MTTGCARSARLSGCRHDCRYRIFVSVLCNAPILGPVTGGIAAAACVAMLLFLTLRALAYWLYTKRFADFLVSILTGLLMLVAYLMPEALPVLALAMLWQLQRRRQVKTWRLA